MLEQQQYIRYKINNNSTSKTPPYNNLLNVEKLVKTFSIWIFKLNATIFGLQRYSWAMEFCKKKMSKIRKVAILINKKQVVKKKYSGKILDIPNFFYIGTNAFSLHIIILLTN